MATFSDGPSANSTASTATLDVTGVTAAVGDLVMLFCAANNAGTSGVSSTSTSVTDGAGNTWDLAAQTNRTQASGANDGTTLTMWTCIVTNALVAATITLNFSPNTASKAALIQYAVPVEAGAMVVESVGPGVTGNASSRSTGAVSVANGMTMLGACAIETDSASTPLTTDSDTTNGSWSTAQTVIADTGAAGTSQTITVQRKTVTATGDQTYNTSTGAGRDSAINYLIVYETLGSFAVTEAADVAAFTMPQPNAGTLGATERRDRAAFTSGPSWPSLLPYPTLAGYAVRPASAVERRPLEFGAPRVYRRTSRPVIEVAVAWQLDADQQALLDGLQATILQEGQESFGVTLLLPAGMSTVSARFRDKLAIRAMGGARWQTTATLEILDRPVMTAAELTTALGDSGALTWPSSFLPYPTLGSWELTPKPAVARTEDLPGLPRTRQRSRNSTTEVPASWELSSTQAAIFDAFFVHRGKDGAQWFDFPLVQAIGTTTTKVRFLGEADWTPRGGANRWSVSAPLEIREREIMTAAEYTAALNA